MGEGARAARLLTDERGGGLAYLEIEQVDARRALLQDGGGGGRGATRLARRRKGEGRWGEGVGTR